MRKFTTMLLASMLCSSTLLPSAQVTYAAIEQKEEKKRSEHKEKNHSQDISYPNADKLPAWDDNYWRYVNDQQSTMGRDWVMGTARGHYDDFHINVDSLGGKKQFEDAYDRLQKDPWLSDRKVRIFVIYLPNCPYTKSYLPQFKKLAMEAQAPVLNCDVSKYRTASLLPYFDVLNTGVQAPTILWESKDGKLHGESGVHSAKRFAEILKECGYTEVKTDEDMAGYSAEDRYKDDELAETNRERIAKGLKPLSMFKKVNDVADIRAKEIVERIEHTRPNGTTFETALQKAGIPGPNLYGENIAAGPGVADAWSVNRAWMNSKGHRANILRESFSHIGIGHYSNTPTAEHKYKDHWAQLFLGHCDMDKMSLSTNSVNVLKGTPISDLGIKVKLHCAAHGESEMPLIDEMVTGYNPEKEGEQSVTVHYGDKTQQLLVTVGKNKPIELKEDMIKINPQVKTNSRDIASYEYTGQPIRPAITVSNPSGEYMLVEGYSYDVRYENNVNVGTGKIIITGKGNYKGRIEKEFKITKRNLDNKLDISGIKKSYEYTGKPVTPSPTIKTKDGLELYEGVDYTVEYKDNVGELVKQVGHPVEVTKQPATITITGKGNYNFKETKQFNFHMNVNQQASETLAFVIGPTRAYSSVTEMFDVFKKWEQGEEAAGVVPKPPHKRRYKEQMQQNYETIIEYSKSLGSGKEFDLSGSFDSKKAELKKVSQEPDTKKGYDILMQNPLVPDAAKWVNEWISVVQKAQGINISNTDKPIDNNNKITVSTVSGLDGMLEQGQTAQLKVDTPQKNDELPKLNPEMYDAVNAIPVSLSVKFTGKNDEHKQVTQPVTVTMDVPKDFDAKNQFVAVFKNTKNRSNEEQVTEIPLSVSKDGKTMSLTTTQVGDFVITQKLPVTDNKNKAVPPANNPELTGVSFGTQADEGPTAPKELKVYRDSNGKVQVNWKNPDLKNYKLKNYTVAFSQNQDMTNAQYVTVNKEKTNLELPNLPTGTYYFTITTNASSDWSDDASRTSLPVILEIPGEQKKEEAFKPVYSISTRSGDNGNLSVTKQTKLSNINNNISSAQAGDTISVTTIANENYLNGWVKVTDVNGNNVPLKKTTTKNGEETYTFIMPANNVTITSSYTLKEVPLPKFRLSFDVGEHGDIIYSDSEVSSQKNKHEVNFGEKVGFQLQPNEDYRVKDVFVISSNDGKKIDLTKEKDNKYSFTMPKSDVTIKATFEKKHSTAEDTTSSTSPSSSSEVAEDTTGSTSSSSSSEVTEDTTSSTSSSSSSEVAEDTTSSTSSSSSNDPDTTQPTSTDKPVSKPTIVTDEKEIEKIVTISSEHGTVFTDTNLQSSHIYPKDCIFDAVKQAKINEELYYQVAQNDTVIGWIAAKDVDVLIPKEINKAGVVKDNTIAVTHFYKGGKKVSLQKNQLVEVKEEYTLPQDKKYVSIYQPQKSGKSKFIGYIEKEKISDLKAIEENENKVALTNQSVWKDLYQTKSESSLNKNQLYKVKRYYDVNGKRLYSVYSPQKNGKDKWLGYVDSKSLKTLKAVNIKEKIITVKSKNSYTLWKDLFYQEKKGQTKHGQNFITPRYYDVNGKRYYSVYRVNKNNKKQWMGYLNSNAVKELKPVKVNKTKTIVKGNYRVWNNLYWTQKLGTTRSMLNHTYKVKYEYHIGNGAKYYSLYNQKNKFVGYVNANAAK